MNWIKQNVGLVIGGVIALILMGVAVYYMTSQIDLEKTVTADLEQQRSLVQQLYNRDPHPGTDKVDNIGAVQKEQARVQEVVLGPVESYFPGFEIPESLSISEFKEILENTLSEMQRDAKYTGISLPSVDQGSYGFSFDDIRPRIDLEPEALRPLTFQLYEIRELCNVLFEAKIHGINAIKRLPVSDNDGPSAAGGIGLGVTSTSTSSSTSAGENYIEDVATQDPNINAITIPFQISFQCFSSELARVMDGFNRSNHYFRIKWMAVEQDGGGSSYGSGMGGDSMMQRMYGLEPSSAGQASRYGGGNPYAGMAGGGQQPVQDNNKLEDLDESPLTVNMSLVAIATFPEEELDSLMPLPSDEEDDGGSGGYGY